MSKSENKSQFGKITRRGFVAGSGAAAAGAAIADVPAMAALRPAHSLQMDDYAAKIGQTFRLRGELGAVKLKLVSVEPLGSEMSTPAGVRSQAFAARFSISDSVLPISENSYRVSNVELGTTELYLMPCKGGICSNQMEAIFN